MTTNATHTETRSNPPHHLPVACRCPFRTNRFIVFSPKAGRRVVLFGIQQFQLWLRLEANPTLTIICERPLLLNDGKRFKPVDFWVSGPDGGKYLLLAPKVTASSNRSQPFFTAFQSWAAEYDCDVEEVEPLPASREQEQWYDNWTLVLQHLTAFRSSLTDHLVSVVRDQVPAPISLGALAQKLPQEDPDHVRAAAFALIHRGVLRFLDLRRERLSDLMEIECA
jgi:hypothetical protein